jgi:hypothetical protein
MEEQAKQEVVPVESPICLLIDRSVLEHAIQERKAKLQEVKEEDKHD